MNSLFKAVTAGLIVSAPVVAFAQSTQPLTRAEVRDQLIQLEKAGYDPAQPDPYYPTNLQAAEARVAAENETNTGVGGSVGASSESGAQGARAVDTQANPAASH